MIVVGYDDVMELGDGDLMMVEKATMRFLMVLDVFIATTKTKMTKALEMLIERNTRWCWRWSKTMRLGTTLSLSLSVLVQWEFNGIFVFFGSVDGFGDSLEWVTTARWSEFRLVMRY